MTIQPSEINMGFFFVFHQNKFQIQIDTNISIKNNIFKHFYTFSYTIGIIMKIEAILWCSILNARNNKYPSLNRSQLNLSVVYICITIFFIDIE